MFECPTLKWPVSKLSERGGERTTASSSHKSHVLKCQNVTLCDHINPILRELHWLPVVYKILLFTYKDAFNDTAYRSVFKYLSFYSSLGCVLFRPGGDGKTNREIISTY